MTEYLKAVFVVIVLITCAAVASHAQENNFRTAADIIKYVEDEMRSDRAYSEVSMEIVTPDWQRTVIFRSYDDREGDRSFIHILTPARDKDTTFLRAGRDLWMYLPRAERTIRIPPSMMMQSWMGSDFTNDDLVRESSYVNDFEHELTGKVMLDDVECYHLVMTPKPDAPSSWGRIEVWVQVDPLIPLRYQYFNQRGELRKQMDLSDVKTMDEHVIPTIWTMTTVDKPGNSTILTLVDIDFNAEIQDRVFSRQYLRNPR